jgi:hypothetical protein
VCHGHDALPRGQRIRCAGFLSLDGRWAHCERPEHAGGLSLDNRTTPPTYLHRLEGPCRCGVEHGPAAPPPNAQIHESGGRRIGRVVATYLYKNAKGDVVYRVARFFPKDFRPQRLTSTGRWAWGWGNVEPVLYRLPELLAAPERTAFVCEGEKDCDRLAALGLLSTTNPSGAGSWRKHSGRYVEAFHGRPRAIVVVDNDPAGRTWADEVATSLTGVGCRVHVLELPTLLVGGDVSDWLDAGGTLEELKRLAAAAPVWAPGGRGAGGGAVRLADVQRESVEWLWHGRVARGKLTLIDGDPGLGKSLLTLDFARPVTTGGAWPDGQSCTVCGSVMLLGAEDGLADTVRPRLDAASVDVQLVYALPMVGGGGNEHQPCIPDDLEAIEEHLRATGAVMLVVDPLMAYLAGHVKSHHDQDVRRALASLAAMAERLHVAVVIIRHLNKSPGAPAIYRGGGSIGIAAAARVVLAVGVDPDDETRHVLVPVKTNLTAPPASLAYRLVDAPGETVRVEWLGASTVTARRLLEVPSQGGRSSLDDAADVLRTILADGPVAADAVRHQAREAGVSEGSLKRAKARAGVISDREGFGAGGFWLWRLRDQMGSTNRLDGQSDVAATYDLFDPLRTESADGGLAGEIASQVSDEAIY